MASRRVWGAETVISNITFQTSLCSPEKGGKLFKTSEEHAKFLFAA